MCVVPAGGAGSIWLAYPLLALLSVFGAPFDPAFSAATPNIVDPQDLPAANALSGSLWGTMLAVGAGLGGIVATVFGRDTAFVIDAVSFGVSALLLWGIRRPFSEEREPGHEHPRMLDATIEVLQYARRDHRVLALIGVKAGFGLAAGVLALLPVFGAEVFDRGEIGVGALMAARGMGALAGPFLGHRISGQGHRRLFGAIGIALTVFGASYMALGLAPSLWIAAGVIFVAHLGGGAQWVLSTFGLQVLVPDHIRGRVFAVDFAMITLSLAVSSLIASAIADSAGPRIAALLVGAMAVVWAIVWTWLTRSIRRRTATEGFAPSRGDGPLARRGSGRAGPAAPPRRRPGAVERPVDDGVVGDDGAPAAGTGDSPTSGAPEPAGDPKLTCGGPPSRIASSTSKNSSSSKPNRLATITDGNCFTRRLKSRTFAL